MAALAMEQKDECVDNQNEHGVAFVTLYARIVNELARDPRIAQEKLAQRLEVTMRTVQRHLTQLELEGFITVQRERKPYTYEIDWNRPLRYFDQLNVGTFRPNPSEAQAEKSRRR